MTIDQITTEHLKAIYDRCITHRYFDDCDYIILKFDGSLSYFEIDATNPSYDTTIEKLNKEFNEAIKYERDKKYEQYLKLKQEFEPNSDAMNILTNSTFGAYVPNEWKYSFPSSDLTAVPVPIVTSSDASSIQIDITKSNSAVTDTTSSFTGSH